MSWHTIDHKVCGHTADHKIHASKVPGPVEDRVKWIAANKLCPDCDQQATQQAREKAATKAAEKAQEYGLPPLSGSAKQVAWAQQIRMETVEECERKLGFPVSELPQKEEDERLRIAQAITDQLWGQTRAAWWIDCRDHALYQVRKAAWATLNGGTS